MQSKPYTLQDWLGDINLASKYGTDGFVLNVGAEEWQFSRVRDCYDAARRITRPHSNVDGRVEAASFELFISFDMSSIHGHRKEDVQVLCNYVSNFGRHSNQLIYKGGVVVSTFAGESSKFGHQTLEAGWEYVKHELEHSISHQVHFIPSFFIDPGRYKSFECMDGYFHWNGGWPIHLKPSSPRHEVHCPHLDSDRHHISNLPTDKTYMAAISPWFFTHYGKDSWNKNWIYRSDDHLLSRRWEHILSIRSSVDIVQIISWNDFGESHYLSQPRYPLVQPKSHAWVDGFSHLGWLDLNMFYVLAFKLERWPTPQEVKLKLKWEDRIWMWGRPHLKTAEVEEEDDPVGKPQGWQLTDDVFWVQTFCTLPGTTVVISCGEGSVRTYDNIPLGMTKLSHAMVPGEGIRVELMRNEELVLLCDSLDGGFVFEAKPKSYNFNAFVCMSG